MSTTDEIMKLATECEDAATVLESYLMNADAYETQLSTYDESRAALLKAVEALEKDAARFAWVLPILSGDDDDLANTRALSLATQFLYGTSTRNAIDAAMKETP